MEMFFNNTRKQDIGFLRIELDDKTVGFRDVLFNIE